MTGMSFANSDVGGLVIAGLAQRHVLAAYTLNNPSVLRLQPPLNVGADVLDEVASRLEEAVAQTMELIAGLDMAE